MPQKPIFTKYPLLSVPHAFLSNGLVRTSDERVKAIYLHASAFSDQPLFWEGLFSLACLVCSEPEREPVAEAIRCALHYNESGAFRGTLREQVDTARAALALFEYNTDKSILKRLAEWVRYIEISWDPLTEDHFFLYRPADFMELLVRFYRVSGIKSVLRLCARLRSDAFDWATALNTFQQHVPLSPAEPFEQVAVFESIPSEMDYDQRQMLINHAESLADGFRYTLFCGLFSGNKQELTACRSAWAYLEKHHRAICGGTTASPLLSGTGSDQAVSNRAIAAWTEAFSSLLLLPDSTWAMDELIRLVFNGLSDCLSWKGKREYQFVNTIRNQQNLPASPELLARICRAVSTAYRHAVTITDTGFNINYRLSGSYVLMVRKLPVIVRMETDHVSFLCKEPFSASVQYYVPLTDSSLVSLNKDGKTISISSRQEPRKEGYYIRINEEWNDQSGFSLTPGHTFYSEETHHHGVCFFSGNTLQCLPAENGDYPFAAFGEPRTEKGNVYADLIRTSKWPLHRDNPADLPVFPSVIGDPLSKQLYPYPNTDQRISMFPRAGQTCLK